MCGFWRGSGGCSPRVSTGAPVATCVWNGGACCFSARLWGWPELEAAAGAGRGVAAAAFLWEKPPSFPPSLALGAWAPGLNLSCVCSLWFLASVACFGVVLDLGVGTVADPLGKFWVHGGGTFLGAQPPPPIMIPCKPSDTTVAHCTSCQQTLALQQPLPAPVIPVATGKVTFRPLLSETAEYTTCV